MIEWVFLGLGIILLLKSADFLIEGSLYFAKKLEVSTLIVGLTIVAFGTSLPELIISIFAALNGNTEVVLGNIIGSNIANILLILGLTSLFIPLKIQHSTVWKEIPFAFLASLLLVVISLPILKNEQVSVYIGVVDGIILLLFFASFLYYIFGKSKTKTFEFQEGNLKFSSWKIFLMIFAGLIGLYFGGKWTVDNAVIIAQNFGVSQFLISATLIALGTSLPELMTSFSAVKRNEVDLAVGNIVGSNIFNMFWILGVTALISPIQVFSFLNFDILFLFVISLMLFLFMFIGARHHLERWQGVIFILLYLFYVSAIILRG